MAIPYFRPLLALALISIPLSASAEIVDTEGLSLRSVPNLSEDGFDCALPKGTKLEVVSKTPSHGKETDWVKVKLVAKIPGCISEGGWVNKTYISKENPVAVTVRPKDLPPAARPAARVEVAKVEVAKAEKEYVTAGRYNLRRDPSTNHDPVRSLPEETPLKIISTRGNWVKVVANGQTGWIVKAGILARQAKSEDCPDCNVSRKPDEEKNQQVIKELNNSLMEKTNAAPAKPVSHCALTTILEKAKISVKNRWNNKPSSGGLCALGVRYSLQTVKPLGISGALGNAIDFLSALRGKGFVDSNIRDPNLAPPGSVIIFSGPRSSEYLRNGHYGRSGKGNWLGHVTIKGDDGYYYTDGKTREPAIGWSGGKNRSRIRNVAGIYVPGPALEHKFDGLCQ